MPSILNIKCLAKNSNIILGSALEDISHELYATVDDRVLS